jgi:hypothetical protein
MPPVLLQQEALMDPIEWPLLLLPGNSAEALILGKLMHRPIGWVIVTGGCGRRCCERAHPWRTLRVCMLIEPGFSEAASRIACCLTSL